MQPDTKDTITCPNCGTNVSGSQKEFKRWRCPKCWIDLEGDHDVAIEDFSEAAYLLGRTLSFIGGLSVIGGILNVPVGLAVIRSARLGDYAAIVAMYILSASFAAIISGCIEIYLGRAVRHGGVIFTRIATDIAGIRHKR